MLNLEEKLSQNAPTVLEKRYLKKDKNGRVVETLEGTVWRVARELSA